MKRWFSGVLVLAVTPLFACTTTLYKSNELSAPLLRHGGEFKGSVSVNNLQLAYGLTDRIGLLANGYYEMAQINNRTVKGMLGEVGGGTFGTAYVRNAVWEAYGGAGLGRAVWDDTVDNGTRAVHYDASALKLFLQPNVGYVTPYFEVSASARLSAVKYLALHTSGYTLPELSQEFLEADAVTGPVWFFFEPGVTVKAGFKWVKLYFQYARTLKLGGGDLRYAPDTRSLGITVDVARWYNEFEW